jgi:aryl-alcohol dehydrogenase
MVKMNMVKIQAAVSRSIEAPFSIESCELSAPGADEVLVKVHACGICHTDLAVKLQHIPIPFPQILGHEGAGIVEAVGENVSEFKPGDHVLMTFGSCGSCSSCLEALPSYCERMVEINIVGVRPGGPPFRQNSLKFGAHFFAQSSFATHALASPRNLVRIDSDLPLDILAPLGCGIQTGMGTVMLALKPPAGTSLVVFGVGAVGLAAVIAARIVGCSTIIAVDILDQRLKVAREVGATHVLDGRSDSLVDQIRAIIGGGAHYSLDTTGNSKAITNATDCLRKLGTGAHVAAPPRGTLYCIPANVLVGGGLTWRGVVEGDSDPKSFIPRLVRLYQEGQLPLERLVRSYPLVQINEAIRDMDAGEVVKPVIVMP